MYYVKIQQTFTVHINNRIEILRTVNPAQITFTGVNLDAVCRRRKRRRPPIWVNLIAAYYTHLTHIHAHRLVSEQDSSSKNQVFQSISLYGPFVLVFAFKKIHFDSQSSDQKTGLDLELDYEPFHTNAFNRVPKYKILQR